MRQKAENMVCFQDNLNSRLRELISNQGEALKERCLSLCLVDGTNFSIAKFLK